MNHSISMKSLSRLQFRQFFRGKKGRDLIGPAILVIYLWLIEFIVYFEVGGKLPALAGLLFLTALIPDFITKIIFERDHTVMDAFLKTRPIPQGFWDRFLTLSQLWNPSNLIVPVAMAPACMLFLPFPTNLVILVVIYLLSAFNGFLVMLIKHRGTYQSEKSASAKAPRTFKSTTGHAVFSLQTKSVLRSKRLRGSMIYLIVFMLLMFICYGRMEGINGKIFLFCVTGLGSSLLNQYGIGVEANFISAIWTRPVSLSRILKDKFRLAMALNGTMALISIPLCVWMDIPVYLPVAYALLGTGVGCPLVLIDAYNCSPFDLFGKTFFNYQGSRGTFKASVILGMTVLLLLAMLLPLVLPEITASLILGGLGLIGFAFHRPFFNWVERKFLRNKHKYIEKYLAK